MYLSHQKTSCLLILHLINSVVVQYSTNLKVKETCDDLVYPSPGWFRKSCKVGYNQFKLPNEEKYPTETVQTNTNAINTTVNLVANMDKQNLVPAKFDGFVPWGHYSTIKQIIKSGLFYPVFITGLSGNGKTLMIEQIHAKLKKELIKGKHYYRN